MERRMFLAGGLSVIALSARAQTAALPTPNAASPAPRPEAGKIDLVEGDVRIVDPNRQLRRPAVGDVVYQGDSIVTGKDSEMHMNMDDGGYIGVRPDTRMRIAVFKAEGGADDRSVIGLLAGSFRSVTGWIGKLGGNHYRINTPTATIGVRGTDHEPLVIPPGGTGGDPGTYDRVHTGETQLRTPQGAVSVKPNQAGFTPHGGGGQPRVLEQIPSTFRASKHDDRFQGLHDRLQQQIGQRQEQRRQAIQQHRAGTAEAGASKATEHARPEGEKGARPQRGPRAHGHRK